MNKGGDIDYVCQVLHHPYFLKIIWAYSIQLPLFVVLNRGYILVYFYSWRGGKCLVFMGVAPAE